MVVLSGNSRREGSKTCHLFSRVVVIQDPIQRLSPFQKKSTWNIYLLQSTKKSINPHSFPPFENKPDMCEKVNIWLIQFCIGKEGSFQLKRQIQF